MHQLLCVPGSCHQPNLRSCRNEERAGAGLSLEEMIPGWSCKGEDQSKEGTCAGLHGSNVTNALPSVLGLKGTEEQRQSLKLEDLVTKC